MIDLLTDVHDDAFSASSSAHGSQPFAARMFDLSIFARNGFLEEQTHAKLIQPGSIKSGYYQSQIAHEPHGNHSK